MTKLDQIKILDNKIKANRAQFMVDRKNAEISAKSSRKLDKYEYLTSEDLGYKPDALTQAKFEYSPLGKVFTAGLEKEDKKEGLLKRLKNIENVGSNRLKSIRPHDLNLDYYLLNKDRFQIQKLYNIYGSLSSIKDKFLFINNFYDKIKDFKNRDVLEDNTDKKNRILSAALMTYKNLLSNYRSEYLENIEDYDKKQKENYDYKNLKDILAEDLLNLNLSWINDNKLYQNVRQDVFNRYKKDKDKIDKIFR